MTQSSRRILAFATKGTGSNEENRLRALLQGLDAEFLPYDKARKLHSFKGLIQRLSGSRNRLIVMEGTGIAGGTVCLLGRLLWGHRYVFSSGDAVGPFVGAHVFGLGLPFGIYERVLCRCAEGFIGWTPYLVGRALTFGVRNAVTAPGWVIGDNVDNYSAARQRARSRWGVDDSQIVFGLAGSLVWNKRRAYCYGLELVRAIRQVERKDVVVVVVGDGTGKDVLAREAGSDLNKRIFLPGSVPVNQVMENLCGFDVASLPQSTDAVGAFRYTTKISEYLSIGLPIVTLRIPAAYDLDLGTCWRLAGKSPWDATFINEVSGLMNSISLGQVEEARLDNLQLKSNTFEKDVQVERVTQFISDLIEPQTKE